MNRFRNYRRWVVFICLMGFGKLSAQVSSDPSFPVDTEPVTIIFNATLGTGGLANFTGDVYAHTGVITDRSTAPSDWKYVKTDWGENTAETKMTRIDDDLYELSISPSIRTYYGVPSTEKILQMAFVFRSADTSMEGKGDGGTDLFIDVAEPGLSIRIEAPKDDAILEPGSTVTITAGSSEIADLKLYVNDQLLAENTGLSIAAEYLFNLTGGSHIIASASLATETVFDSTYVFVRDEVISETKPERYLRGINYIDDQSVALVLFAPKKSYVYVVGDFNQWTIDSQYQMKKDGDYFWLDIQGLEAGRSYVFQYYIDGEVKIADPYTDQVSDPDNDKYISRETYPDLVAYPEGKAEGIASVLTTAQKPYAWEVVDFVPPPHNELVIYELLIRDFSEAHTYKRVREKLDYLEGLGINALELMPFNEFEGNISWGYNPSFYFAPDKYYGPKNELKRLVDECHKRGIAVIMDLVLNHSYGQSPLVQMYWDESTGRPASDNPWYNQEHNFLNPDAQWGYDFNHDSPETELLVDSINTYWMSEYRIDGFRFDFTKGFSNTVYGSDSWGSPYDGQRIANLERMANAIWAFNPHAIVSFEHLSDNSEEIELADHGILLWGNMNYNYAEAAMSYHESGKSDLSWGIWDNRNWTRPNLITYMESHDEERVAYKCSAYGNSLDSYSIMDTITYLSRLKLNAFFLLPLPGPKMIWQFGEVGYDYSIEENGRTGEKPVRWDYFEDPRRKDLYEFYHLMIRLKNEVEVFDPEDAVYNLRDAIKTYQLKKGSTYILAVGNFDVKERDITLDLPESGIWYEFFTDAELSLDGTEHMLKLKQGGYKLFSNVKIEGFEELITGDLPEANPERMLDIYPNPSQNSLTIAGDGIYSLEIFDLQGKRHLMVSQINLPTIQLDITDLHSGLYILRTTDWQGKVSHTRFLKHNQ